MISAEFNPKSPTSIFYGVLMALVVIAAAFAFVRLAAWGVSSLTGQPANGELVKSPWRL